MGIQSAAPGSPVSSDEINQVSLPNRPVADAILAEQPAVGKLVSTDDFYGTVWQIFQSISHQRKVVAGIEDRNEHAMARSMVSRVYTGRNIALSYSGKTYTKWSQDKGIDISQLSKENAQTLLGTIFNKITGADSNSVLSLADVQSAMISAMQNINSYTVQYLHQANDGSYLKTDHATLRPANLRASGGDNISINIPTVSVVSLKEAGKVSVSAKLSPIGVLAMREQGVYPLAAQIPVLELRIKPVEQPRMVLALSGLRVLNNP